VLVVVFAVLIVGGALVQGAVGGTFVVIAWVGVAVGAAVEQRQRVARMDADQRRRFQRANAGNWAIGATVCLILAICFAAAYANVGGPLRAVAAGVFFGLTVVLSVHTWHNHRAGAPT
jgi:hypothetical protein